MNTNDLLLPSALKAESAVIGSLIIDPKCLSVIDETGLGVEMFHNPAHISIYSAMLTVLADSGKLDTVLLTQKLIDRGELEQVGGVPYLVETFDSVPHAASAGHYASLVVEAYRKRQIINHAERTLRNAYKSDEKADEQAWAASAGFEAIAAGSGQSKVVTRQEAFEAAYKELNHKAEFGYIQGVRTGFHQIDEDMAGLKPGNLYLLAARPAMGKTALALQIANNAAEAGTPTMFVSIEMPPEQIGMRDLAYSSGMSLAQVRQPSMMGADEWAAVERAREQKREGLYIHDAPGETLARIEAAATRLKSQKDIGLIMIDYLQLMTLPKGMKKYEGVGANSKGCKQMARRLGVPVILLSQLNRGSEQRPNSRPSMADLRDSGEIEESADAVAMIHRNDYYRLQADPEAELDHEAEIILGKNRHGPTGTSILHFAGGAFSNMENQI
ncbi:replicative DNA helicase [bacterium]|nr:replicative DNA helicase [bacterium]